MKCGMKLVAVTLMSACAVGPLWAEEKQADWTPLWNTKDFAGWHEIGSGQWTIEDGAIVGRHEKSDPKFGHMVTDKTYADFTARLKFKTLKGNSGFYFRVDKQGFSGVEGFQAEIDPTHDTGGLYDTGGRAWVVKPTAEEIKRFFKPHQWNEMIVTAKGRNVTVHVNGIKTAELTDDPGRTKGHIALQLHGGNEMLVMFKDIEIREE